MKRASAVLIFLMLILASARADWRLAAETGALFESNLSNSDRSADEKSDWAWKTTAQLDDGFQLSRDLRLNLGADVRGLVWSRFDAFDEIGGGVFARLRYRFGLGSQAPWILLEERIGYDDFKENFLNHWDETLRLRGGVAVTERVALEVGYTFENLAAQGEFFDQQGHRAEARVVVDLGSSLQIALGHSYRNGDIISYAVPPRPDLVQIAPVRPGLTTFGDHPLYNAYRLPAESHAISVVVGYSLTKNLSLQMTYEYALTLHDPLRYQNHTVEAKIAFAY